MTGPALVAFYPKFVTKLATWMKQNLPEGITVDTLIEPRLRLAFI